MLIDVRAQTEFQRVHAAFAHSLPLHRLNADLVRELLHAEDNTVYLICERGSLVRLANERLESQGFAGSILVEGGTNAWIEAGLPVIRGPRQPQISTKSAIAIEALLIVLAMALGFSVHVGFLFLFIGLAAGLGALHDWRFDDLFENARPRAKTSP